MTTPRVLEVTDESRRTPALNLPAAAASIVGKRSFHTSAPHCARRVSSRCISIAARLTGQMPTPSLRARPTGDGLGPFGSAYASACMSDTFVRRVG